MNVSARSLLLGTVLFAGGAVLGHVSLDNTTGKSPPPEVAGKISAPPRPGTTAKAAASPEGKRDLATLRKNFANRSGRGGGLRNELERLPVAALKELLLEQMAHSSDGAMKERQARYSVISGALSELYRREGVAAIEWVSNLENQSARRSAMRTILTTSVRDHPDVAMPWILKFLEQNGKNSIDANTFAATAFSGAAERGADELIRVYGMFPDKLRGDPFHLTKFTAEFDFAKFHTALTGKVDMASIYDGWAARDREGAWQGVKSDLAARGQAGSRYFGSLVLAAAAQNGEKAGMKWAAERMAELPPDQREHCLAGIDHLGKLTVEGISAVTAALPPEDRKVLAQGMLNRTRGEAKAIAALSSLPRAEMLDVLQQGYKRNSGILFSKEPSSFSQGMRTLYQQVETHFALTPEEIQQARGAAAAVVPPSQ